VAAGIVQQPDRRGSGRAAGKTPRGGCGIVRTGGHLGRCAHGAGRVVEHDPGSRPKWPACTGGYRTQYPTGGSVPAVRIRQPGLHTFWRSQRSLDGITAISRTLAGQRGWHVVGVRQWGGELPASNALGWRPPAMAWSVHEHVCLAGGHHQCLHQ